MNYEGILDLREHGGIIRQSFRTCRQVWQMEKYIFSTWFGKTTLGIGQFRRMNGKTLILAPSITIREQWIGIEGFLM